MRSYNAQSGGWTASGARASSARVRSVRPGDDFDAAKVARLRAEIAAGIFWVDASLIAARMLDDA